MFKKLWRDNRITLFLSPTFLYFGIDGILAKKVMIPFGAGWVTEFSSPVFFWIATILYLGVGLITLASIFLSLLPPKKKTTVPFGEQISRLNRSGILTDPKLAQRLQGLNPTHEYEEDPYFLIFHAISEINESGQAERRIPANFFYLDCECIDGKGDYVALAKQMAHISQGHIQVDGLLDEFDEDRKKAVLKGKLNDTAIRWEFPFEDDYVSGKLFAEFQKVLGATNSGKRYMALDLGGQDLFVFCVTPEQIKGLSNETGLKLGEL
jgi:hypothetical protein